MKHAIFMYHSISEAQPDPNGICVAADRFAEQLETLKRRGYHGVSMRELLAGAKQGSKAKLVGLTFDDGYADFLGHRGADSRSRLASPAPCSRSRHCSAPRTRGTTSPAST